MNDPIPITTGEADQIVKFIVMASQALYAGLIGEECEDADVLIDGKQVSVRAIDDGLLAAVRIIRSKQGR